MLHTKGTTAPALVIERPDPRAELDTWDDAIAQLDQALGDMAEARQTIETESTTLERLEAGDVLRIEGGNAETRKARLTLALADNARYETCRRRHTEARQALWDAERRLAVTREHCRLVRASVALAVGGEVE